MATILGVTDLEFALDADHSSIANLSDNANVTSWTDPITGRTAAPSGTAPKKQTFNGLPVIHFSGDDPLVTESFLDSSYNEDFTIIAVYRSFAVDGAPQPSVAAGNGTLRVGSSLSSGSYYNTFVSTPINYTGIPSAGYSQIVTYRYDGADFSYSVNKQEVHSASATGNLGLSGALSIGQSGANTSLYGYVRQLYVFKRSITDGERDTLVDFLADKNPGFSGDYTNLYIFIGDSQTGTSGGTVTYVDLINDQLDTDEISYNFVRASALEGRTMQQTLDNAPAELEPWLMTPNTDTQNIAVLWESTNDFIVTDAAGVQERFIALATYLTGRGVKLVATTVLFINGGDDADQRRAYNTWLRANYQLYAHKLADIAADPDLASQDPEDVDGFGNPDFFGDIVHCNDAGKARVAEIVYPLITSEFPELGGASITATTLNAATLIVG